MVLCFSVPRRWYPWVLLVLLQVYVCMYVCMCGMTYMYMHAHPFPYQECDAQCTTHLSGAYPEHFVCRTPVRPFGWVHVHQWFDAIVRLPLSRTVASCGKFSALELGAETVSEWVNKWVREWVGGLVSECERVCRWARSMRWVRVVLLHLFVHIPHHSLASPLSAVRRMCCFLNRQRNWTQRRHAGAWCEV